MNMYESEISIEFNRQACLLLSQSLRKIEHCLSQIAIEQCWWRPAEGLNSIGNLLQHMNGNLRQWAIAGLTTVADTRDRRAEFLRDRHEKVDDLWRQTLATVEQAEAAIRDVDPKSLIQSINIQGFQVSTMQAILHTTAHFQGHTHQIILLTRMQLGDRYQFEWSPESERGELPM